MLTAIYSPRVLLLRAALHLLWISSAWLGFAPLPTLAQPRVEVVLDLLEAFHPERAREALSVEIRRPATAGGIKQNALFEHPRSPEQPARVEYELSLPSVGSDERLMLGLEIALADGVEFKKPGVAVDGVRFGVEVDGNRLFAEEYAECRWRPAAVDLTSYAGKRIRINLITEALTTSNFDWALWGNPRVLRFFGSALKAPGRTSTTVGALAIPYRAGKNFSLRLRPLGDGEALEWREPKGVPADNALKWIAFDVNYTNAFGVALECEPADAMTTNAIWFAPYPPQPHIMRLSSVRAVSVAGEPLSFQIQIQNAGRGKLDGHATQVDLTLAGQSLDALFVPTLGPGETWRGEWEGAIPPAPGPAAATARLTRKDGSVLEQRTNHFEIFPPPAVNPADVLQNDQIKLEFLRADGGFAYARVSARHQNGWINAALWQPLMQATRARPNGDVVWPIRLKALKRTQNKEARGGVFEFHGSVQDPSGIEWSPLLRVTLEPNGLAARIEQEWRTAAPREVKALWGPNLYVGEGSFGESKTWGLFPGLEYLYAGERSSNPRDLAPPVG